MASADQSLGITLHNGQLVPVIKRSVLLSMTGADQPLGGVDTPHNGRLVIKGSTRSSR
ncbi:hypothetical protein PCANC_04757 [Puccinia coronata f. sp. avenae]|uniref:Uncharacterized protein n=1 Tax=Puccinia coronata f. sp. avenae TaxID=200324 RepID=A0A2N5VWS0_9BASI|nr:hypothetical protein PCANC_04757 [Puccinia coronata f. sp. avenae]